MNVEKLSNEMFNCSNCNEILFTKDKNIKVFIRKKKTISRLGSKDLRCHNEVIISTPLTSISERTIILEARSPKKQQGTKRKLSCTIGGSNIEYDTEEYRQSKYPRCILFAPVNGGPFAVLHQDIGTSLLSYIFGTISPFGFRSLAAFSATCKAFRSITQYFVQNLISKDGLDTILNHNMKCNLLDSDSFYSVRFLAKLFHMHENEHMQDITIKVRAYIGENFTIKIFMRDSCMQLQQSNVSKMELSESQNENKLVEFKKHIYYRAKQFFDREALFIYILENFFLENKDKKIDTKWVSFFKDVLIANKNKHSLRSIESLIQTLGNELTKLDNDALLTALKILHVVVEAKVFNREDKGLQVIKDIFYNGFLNASTVATVVSQLVKNCHALFSNEYIDPKSDDEVNRFFGVLISNINIPNCLMDDGVSIYIINGLYNCLTEGSFVLNAANFKSLQDKYKELENLNIDTDKQYLVHQVQVVFDQCMALLEKQNC